MLLELLSLFSLLFFSFFFLDFFLFFSVVFCIYLFLNFSWSGLFFIQDSFVFVLLIFISIIIISIIFLSEKSENLLYLTEVLIFVCFLFFIPRNFLILYIFFELSIFPILVIILGFGSQVEKIRASYYLIFYASLCSFPFLYVYFNVYFFFSLVYVDFFISWELFFILSLSFIIKFPVYFLHLWLPKAHVEAPTSASMLLAGLLLKLGTAGFFRVLRSLSFLNSFFWILISFFGIVFGSFLSVFQRDSKSLAAYSSVTHIGFLLISLLLLRVSSKRSGFFLILAHGYTSTLMFYVIGDFYHSRGRRIVYFINSFFSISLVFGIFFSFVFLSNGGIPPSLSFFSEFFLISNFFLVYLNSVFIVFVYFLVSFYYSLYFITNGLMGGFFSSLLLWNSGYFFYLLLIIYNLFWFSVFFLKVNILNFFF